MKTLLMLSLVLICFTARSQQSHVSSELFNIEDSLSARLLKKYGDKACCPWKTAGFPTRRSSYSFNNLIISNGEITISPNVDIMPIPQTMQFETYSFPNSERKKARITHQVSVRELSGNVLTLDKSISGSFISSKGEINETSTGYKYNLSISKSSYTNREIKTLENVVEKTLNKTLEFEVGGKRIKTITVIYTQSIASRSFDGILVIDGTLTNNHIMALDGGGWVGPVSEDCKISDKLTLEERTFKISGKIGNLNVGKFELSENDERFSDN